MNYDETIKGIIQVWNFLFRPQKTRVNKLAIITVSKGVGTAAPLQYAMTVPVLEQAELYVVLQ
jgi:hypothetical protein